MTKPMMFVTSPGSDRFRRIELTAEQVTALDHLIESLDVSGQPLAIDHPTRIVDRGRKSIHKQTITISIAPRDGSEAGSMWVEWHEDRWLAFHDSTLINGERIAYEGPVVQS